MNSDHKNSTGGRLTTGAVGPTLVRMALGLLGGHAAMIAFNATDTYFVSQLGHNELAAMAFTFPVIMVLLNMVFGLGIGTGAMVAKATGEGNPDLARRYTIHACVINLCLAISLSAIGLLSKRWIFMFLGADEETLKLVNEYMVPWFLGFPFFVIPMTINNALRALGEVKYPTIIMSTAAFLNFLLDPLLIFGLGKFPGFGLQGAALATIGSRFFTLFAVLYIAEKRLQLISVRNFEVPLIFKSAKALLRIGIPAMSSLLLFPIAINIVTGIVARSGNAAVAAYGAGGKIDMLAYLPIFALSNALLAFYGQNLGAGKYERIREGHRLSMRFALCWGLLMACMYIFLRHPLAGIFAKDAETYNYLISYMLWAPMGFFGANIIILGFSELNGLHKPLMSTAMSVMRSFGLVVIPAFIGQHLFGAVGVFAAQGMGTIGGGIVCFVIVNYSIKSLSKGTAVHI
ncbi:MAG: MATE family efflux transporter [Opitutales bacterium]|nr:MATE family efflux transporter [Opitutales bacterium]